MSQVLIVAFELARPGQNSETLVARIKAYGQWARLGASTYLIQTQHLPVDVRAYLQEALFPNDKLYVSLVGYSAAWVGYPEAFSTWVRQRQGPSIR